MINTNHYLVWLGMQMITMSLDEHAGGQLNSQRQDRRTNGFPFYFGRHYFDGTSYYGRVYKTIRHPSEPFDRPIVVYFSRAQIKRRRKYGIQSKRIRRIRMNILYNTTDRTRVTTDKTLNRTQHSYLPKRVGYER